MPASSRTHWKASLQRFPWGGHVFLLGSYVVLSALFQGLSLFFGYKRHLFGVELLLAMVLFALGWRLTGAVALIAAIALELTLGLASVFYLFNTGQLLDLTEYLFEARHAYLVALAALPLLAGMVIWSAMRVANKAGSGVRLAWPLLLIGVALFQGQWMLSSERGDFFMPALADRQHLLFGSATHLVHGVMDVNGWQTVGSLDSDADYVPIRHPSAAQLVWGGRLPTSSRILFVVAEAWGLPNEAAVLESQIQALRQNNHVQDLRLDHIHAVGATAAGELREMCGVIPTRLNFRLLTSQAVGDCLPAQLSRQGYVTVGVHGAVGSMYRRTLWWPQLGLAERLFKDDIVTGHEPCRSFPGHCDRDLLETVKHKLSADKVFLYWLTLNSHMPYDLSDVAHYRQALCNLWPTGASEQLCNYQNLHTQFFDGLSSLAADPGMTGVEVVVVGDHPPLFNDAESRERFSRDQVPVLRFVVK